MIEKMLNENITISIALIFSIISMIGVAVNIANTVKRNTEINTQKELSIEKNFAKLEVKLDEFGRLISDISKRSEKNADRIDYISQEITKQNERISTLFHYHDDHERRIIEMEKKINENKP